jgi:hypothetical protein
VGRKWREAGEDCIMRSFILVRFTDYFKVIKSRMRWAGHVARMREVRNAHNILAGKTEGKSTRKA